MESIKGKFKRVIYEASGGNGYKIGLFRVKEAGPNLQDLVNRTITFTGYFYDLILDENYIFNGTYVKNSKYGFQFQVASYEHVKPEGKDAVIDFLSSSLVKGCGEKTAIKIVEILGEDAISKIKENKDVLLEVPKMTKKKADSIYNSVLKYEGSDEIILYLTKCGFTMREATTLLNVYGPSIKAVVEENVYTLIKEIDFKSLDKVFFTLHEETDDNRRLACIIQSMKELAYDIGDTYLFIDDIKTKLKSFNIIFSEEELTKFLDILVKNREVKKDKDKYFLYYIYQMEKKIADKLFVVNSNEICEQRDYLKDLEKFTSKNGITYNKEQKKAILTALKENITIITGGPGTGKTTIIKAITNLYIDTYNGGEYAATEKLALLAPTGRAAKRMSDVTGLPASTIHRFLRWDKSINKFDYNEYNKRQEKFIIVDEASMIDTELFYSLLIALDDDIKLIIVGDDNQLPSVGPGLILTDLINSDCFNHIPLKEIYRQASGSSIPYFCGDIREHNLTPDSFTKKDDFVFLNVEHFLIKDTIKEICKLSIKKGINVKDIQVLAPMYKGENGIDNLNILLQELFNPPSETKLELKVGDTIYRVGDKVLQLVNDPDNNIYNGDIGYVSYVDEKNKDAVLTVDFYGSGVYYKREELINIKHAYAITIHKSQGSEFDHVIMPVTMNYGRMLYNKLLYTGVSRAKKSLIVLGNQKAFYYGTNNDYSLNRKTNLVENLLNNLK